MQLASTRVFLYLRSMGSANGNETKAAVRPSALLLSALALVACSQSGDGEPGDGDATGGSVASAGTSGLPGGSAGHSGAGASAGGAAHSGAAGRSGAAGSGGSTAGSAGQASRELDGCRVALECDKGIVDAEKRPCALRISDGAGNTVYSDFAGVELRGRSSIEYPKKNYSVELRTSTGDEKPTNLFGMGQEADWVLDGSWADRSFVRNDLVFQMFRDMGRYAPESRYCTLELDGEARGIYRLCERIKRDDDRVSLAEDDGTGKSFLIKQDADGILRLDLGLEREWDLLYPNEALASDAQLQAIQKWLDGVRSALAEAQTGGSDALFSLLDVDAIVDFILVEEFSKNVDAYNLSLHLARNAGMKAWLIPWDLDLSFGQPSVRGNDNGKPEGWIANRTDFVRALSRSEDFRSRLGVRWRALRAGPFSDAAMTAKLDRLVLGLDRAAIEQNTALWPLNEVDFSEIYAPYTFYSVSSHAEEIALLRAWIRKRLEYMDASIDDYPN